MAWAEKESHKAGCLFYIVLWKKGGCPPAQHGRGLSVMSRRDPVGGLALNGKHTSSEDLPG